MNKELNELEIRITHLLLIIADLRQQIAELKNAPCCKADGVCTDACSKEQFERECI